MATRGTVIVLDAMNVQVVCPNNTSINVLWSYVLPGDWMDKNSTIRLTLITTSTISANVKRLYCYFGAFNFASYPQTLSYASYNYLRTVSNRNSKTAQVSETINAFGPLSQIGLPTYGAINTNNPVTISVAFQKDAAAVAAGESATIEKVLLELLP